jgi:hypothetical protein
MDLKMLQDYSNWVGKTPKEILEAVKQVGGWASVFPDKLPIWAHRVRNYFNREPRSLERLDAASTKRLMTRLEYSLPTKSSFTGYFAEKYALTGDVYKDAQGWVWYQMNEGGTIYHWGSHPGKYTAPLESGYQEVKEKLGIPVPIFKLVAPDGTGGSRETILRNPHKIFTAVKKEKFLAYVGHLIITDYWDQGSYNYSETVKAGYPAHVMRDVDPHNKYPFPNVYANPTDRFSSIAQRVFPEKINGENNPLAKQI